MIKKILVFNYAGPEDRKKMPGTEDNGDFRGYYGWQQSIASLMDGLVSLSDITVFSTTPLNYGYKVPLKNSERKKNKTFFGKTCYSYILDEESYVQECKDVADECDVILIMEEENPENVEGEVPDDQRNKIEDKFKELSEAYERLDKWISERDNSLESRLANDEVPGVKMEDNGEVSYNLGAIVLRGKASQLNRE